MAIDIKMFTSPTCGPCKMMKPIIESVVAENNYSFVKHCIIENPELAVSEQIQYVPTIKIYKDGELKETITGMKSKQMIQTIIEGL